MATRMKHLPWRLLIFKGLVKFTEFLAIDLFDLPAFKAVTAARDDLVLFLALLFYFVSHEWSASSQRSIAEPIQSHPQAAN